MLNFLNISLIMFIISFFGICFFKKNMINLLICMEVLLLSINFNFVIFSNYLDDIIGQIYSLTILSIAAGETSLGLALIIVYYRLSGGLSFDLINLLKS